MFRLCGKRAVLLGCLWLALLGASHESFGAETQRITILHTNDLHGMLVPFDYPGAPLQHVPPMKNAGGLARRAALVKRIRSAAKNPVLFLDAGDVFTQGPWHRRFYGEPEIEAMNLMGYDAMCVGNNEFQATGTTEAKAKMLMLMRRSRFPWIAANLTVGDTGVPVEGIHPFVVRRAGKLRVGLLGLTAERSAYYPQTQGWTISDAVDAAKRWVPVARKECDVLIAVTHVGMWRDRQIARQVAGIDAIVGGDTHIFAHAPEMVKNPDGVLVPIVQAGEYGVMLGKLDLVFEKKDAWRLVRTEYKLIPLDSSVPEDGAVKELLESYLGNARSGSVPRRAQDWKPSASRTERSGYKSSVSTRMRLRRSSSKDERLGRSSKVTLPLKPTLRRAEKIR